MTPVRIKRERRVDWHVRVTDWNGIVTYEGPAPCPDEFCTITLEMAVKGQVFTFDMTPVRIR